MICPECGKGIFKSYNAGYRKRTGKYTRIRKCNKCGYKRKTIEITTETYNIENELMQSIVDAVNRYSNLMRESKSD